MFELRILIPQADNDGRQFLPNHHAQFEAVLIDLFGGFTKYGEAVGGWKDGERVYSDALTVYGVAVASIVDAAKVAEMAETAKAHYEQLAVYVTYLGQAEVI
jgi:hypothetical protein